MQETFYSNEHWEHDTFCDNIWSEAEFSACTFSHCSFSNITLEHITLTDCHFDHCQISSPSFFGTQVHSSTFTHCTLANIPWSEVAPTGRLSTMIEEMTHCTLKYCQFEQLTLDKVNFKETQWYQCMFAGCSMKQSYFSKTQFRESEFFQCDLQKSNFQDATGYVIDLNTCTIKGSTFSMPEVLNLLDSYQIHIK